MFDVIAIGDTTQDVFLQMSDAEVKCDEQGKNCQFCLRYADKIGVEKKTDIPAVGNAANNAIGVARLGLQAAIYTVVGEDDQGRKAREIFEQNKVSTKFLTFDKERGTNLSIVINYRGERTILVYHEPRSYELPLAMTAKWIYLTSASGHGVGQLHEQVLGYLKEQPEVKVAFNPGTFQINLGLEKLKPILERTQLLFVNREESQEILAAKSDRIEDLMQGFRQVGVKEIIMTDGPKGSYVSAGKKIYFLDIFKGPVVERTGTGDAYGSGFISAIIKGKTVPEAMLWGNANSTSVLQHIGARAGLLEEAGINKLLAANSQVKVEEYGTI